MLWLLSGQDRIHAVTTNLRHRLIGLLLMVVTVAGFVVPVAVRGRDTTKKGSGVVCAKHSEGRPGKRLPTPFSSFENRKLGSILNNDVNNILWGMSGAATSAAEYKKAVLHLLDAKPRILAQNVGLPDPVIYRSKVATGWDKYHDQIRLEKWPETAKTELPQGAAMRALVDAGTDPLELTIQACRERRIRIVASYRMNAEDFYDRTLDLSDFGREHKDWRIAGAHCLDPARPEVFKQRMDIFREVASNYDVDGIEFDFKRWSHMISEPHQNHPILTRMVAETRKMLDEVARRKGRDRLLLGVRVSFSLAGPGDPRAMVPGADFNCKDLGLDVKTWIEKGYVDYVCPSYFWPRWPGLPNTREFVELAKGTAVGIYPTVWPLPAWLEEGPDKGPIDAHDTTGRLRRYKDELCRLVLQCYDDGADGISTFNWVPHHQPGMLRDYFRKGWGLGPKKVQMHIHSILHDRAAIERYLRSDTVLP